MKNRLILFKKPFWSIQAKLVFCTEMFLVILQGEQVCLC